MTFKIELLAISLLFGSSVLGQKMNLADSLKCTQYLDSLSGRMIYRFPEKDVRFKGGQEGVAEYISRLLDYDKRKIKSQVIISFTMIVETDGTVSHVTLKKAPSSVQRDVIENGLAILRSLPRARPAECDGRQVPVRMTIPIVLIPQSN